MAKKANPNEVTYHVPWSYQKVEVTQKNFFQRLRCQHEYRYLVQMDKNWLYNLRGDNVAHICPKCGHIKSIMLWEYEGMGYK